MLKVCNVSFSYGKKKILSDFGFELEKGRCLVLAGPNGCGKSTALAVIAGVLEPDCGSVIAQGKIGYVPQGTALFEDMSVEDNLGFFASLAGTAVPQRLPFGLDKVRKQRAAKLSGGMKKLLSIACGMLGQPEILLLDEACAGLDPEHRREFIQLLSKLKEQGLSLVFVSHEPEEFREIYDEILFLGRETRTLAGRELDADRLQEEFIKLFEDEKQNQRKD